MCTDFYNPKYPLEKKFSAYHSLKNIFKNNISPEKSRIPEDFTKFEDIPIQYMNQVHGNKIRNNILSFIISHRRNRFFIFFDQQSCLGVLTADCLPIALSKNDGSEFVICMQAGKAFYWE